MTKDYYKILGVTRNASDAEIKQAYRALAVKFHPDKTTDKQAHDQFVAVNEAYQTLSDKEKKLKYDYLYEYVIIRGQYPPGYVRHQAARSYYRRYYNIREQRERWTNSTHAAASTAAFLYPEKIRKIFKVFCMMCLTFALIIFADYYIPYQTWLQDVELYTFANSRTGVTYVVETASVQIPVKDPLLLEDKAEVVSTRILNIVRYIRLSYNGSQILRYASSIYDNFIFLPIGLFVSSLAGLRFQRTEDILVKAGIANIFILMLLIAVL